MNINIAYDDIHINQVNNTEIESETFILNLSEDNHDENNYDDVSDNNVSDNDENNNKNKDRPDVIPLDEFERLLRLKEEELTNNNIYNPTDNFRNDIFRHIRKSILLTIYYFTSGELVEYQDHINNGDRVFTPQFGNNDNPIYNQTFCTFDNLIPHDLHSYIFDIKNETLEQNWFPFIQKEEVMNMTRCLVRDLCEYCCTKIIPNNAEINISLDEILNLKKKLEDKLLKITPKVQNNYNYVNKFCIFNHMFYTPILFIEKFVNKFHQNEAFEVLFSEIARFIVSKKPRCNNSPLMCINIIIELNSLYIEFFQRKTLENYTPNGFFSKRWFQNIIDNIKSKKFSIDKYEKLNHNINTAKYNYKPINNIDTVNFDKYITDMEKHMDYMSNEENQVDDSDERAFLSEEYEKFKLRFNKFTVNFNRNVNVKKNDGYKQALEQQRILQNEIIEEEKNNTQDEEEKNENENFILNQSENKNIP
jgi:hypothetical protein